MMVSVQPAHVRISACTEQTSPIIALDLSVGS